jgi:hypothetical protein
MAECLLPVYMIDVVDCPRGARLGTDTCEACPFHKGWTHFPNGDRDKIRCGWKLCHDFVKEVVSDGRTDR